MMRQSFSPAVDLWDRDTKSPALVAAIPRQAGDLLSAEEFATACASAATHVQFRVFTTRDGEHIVSACDTYGDHAIADLVAGAIGDRERPPLGLERALYLASNHHKKVLIDVGSVSPAAYYEATPYSTHEVKILAAAVAALGPGSVVATSTNDASAKVMSDWARDNDQPLLVGISLRDAVNDATAAEARKPTDRSELYPSVRFAETGAGLIMGPPRAALLRLSDWSWFSRVPLVVGPVDDRRAMHRIMRDQRTWMVSTHNPHLAPVNLTQRIAATRVLTIIGALGLLLGIIGLACYVVWGVTTQPTGPDDWFPGASPASSLTHLTDASTGTSTGGAST